jgi:hypothetical protein
MNPRVSCIVCVGVVAGILTSQGCRSPASAEPGGKESAETVRALRYKRICYDSVLDMTHGAGRWVEELYFPEENVVAPLEEITWYDQEAGQTTKKPCLHAYHGKIGNKFKLSILDEKDTEEPTEEVQVPIALAREIFALADLTKRQSDESDRLGEKAFGAGILRLDVKPPPAER